jgi:hypothetical protein
MVPGGLDERFEKYSEKKVKEALGKAAVDWIDVTTTGRSVGT